MLERNIEHQWQLLQQTLCAEGSPIKLADTLPEQANRLNHDFWDGSVVGSFPWVIGTLNALTIDTLHHAGVETLPFGRINNFEYSAINAVAQDFLDPNLVMPAAFSVSFRRVHTSVLAMMQTLMPDSACTMLTIDRRIIGPTEILRTETWHRDYRGKGNHAMVTLRTAYPTEYLSQEALARLPNSDEINTALQSRQFSKASALIAPHVAKGWQPAAGELVLMANGAQAGTVHRSHRPPQGAPKQVSIFAQWVFGPRR